MTVLTRTTRQILLSLALLAGAALVAGLLFLNRPTTELAAPEVPPLTVDVLVATPQTVRIPIQTQGHVQPLRQTVLAAEVQGRIVEVAPSFLKGGFLRAGDTLLRIDARDYAAALAEAESAVRSAESQLIQEQGRAEVAAEEWRRLPQGSQRSEQARDLYLRKPQLAQAEAQLQAANARLAAARDDLERTTLRAPYDALITERRVELGQYVTPGTAIAALASTATAEVRLPVPQARLAWLDLPALGAPPGNTPVTLRALHDPDQRWQATLHRSEAVLDAESRTLYAVARIQDPYRLDTPGSAPLRLGSYVSATLRGRPLDGIVTLPRHLLRPGNRVAIVSDAGLATLREVSLLATGGDVLYITEGLTAGDRVILSLLDSSQTGARVEVISSQPSDQWYAERTEAGAEA